MRGGVGHAAAGVRVGSLISMVSHLPISDLDGCLLNELVVVLVLLRNLGEGVFAVSGTLVLLIHHFVFGPVDVALQKVAEMRVVICLALVSAEETRNLILLRITCVKNRIFTGGAGLVVQIL